MYMHKDDLILNNLQWLSAINPTKPNYTYSIFMHKEDLALNDLQGLICHKTKPNKIIYIQYICMKRIWH